MEPINIHRNVQFRFLNYVYILNSIWIQLKCSAVPPIATTPHLSHQKKRFNSQNQRLRLRMHLGCMRKKCEKLQKFSERNWLSGPYGIFHGSFDCKFTNQINSLQTIWTKWKVAQIYIISIVHLSNEIMEKNKKQRKKQLTIMGKCCCQQKSLTISFRIIFIFLRVQWKLLYCKKLSIFISPLSLFPPGSSSGFGCKHEQ